MCIKTGDTELSSVKALMTMSLNAVIAQVFGLELEEISAEMRVFDDLHMNDEQAAELSQLVAEYFDGRKLEFTPATTLGDIHEQVVEREFTGIPPEAF